MTLFLFFEKKVVIQMQGILIINTSPIHRPCQHRTPELTPEKVNITVLLLIITTLHITPQKASFFKFKHEPEVTNDSCNMLFDTNHF